LDRWLATLTELEQNWISPFIILTFCSSEFVEFLIGYSPPSSHIRTFQLALLKGSGPVVVEAWALAVLVARWPARVVSGRLGWLGESPRLVLAN
jgi:hypothetical protein